MAMATECKPEILAQMIKFQPVIERLKSDKFKAACLDSDVCYIGPGEIYPISTVVCALRGINIQKLKTPNPKWDNMNLWVCFHSLVHANDNSHFILPTNLEDLVALCQMCEHYEYEFGTNFIWSKIVPFLNDRTSLDEDMDTLCYLCKKHPPFISYVLPTLTPNLISECEDVKFLQEALQVALQSYWKENPKQSKPNQEQNQPLHLETKKEEPQSDSVNKVETSEVQSGVNKTQKEDQPNHQEAETSQKKEQPNHQETSQQKAEPNQQNKATNVNVNERETPNDLETRSPSHNVNSENERKANTVLLAKDEWNHFHVCSIMDIGLGPNICDRGYWIHFVKFPHRYDCWRKEIYQFNEIAFEEVRTTNDVICLGMYSGEPHVMDFQIFRDSNYIMANARDRGQEWKTSLKSEFRFGTLSPYHLN